MRERDWQDPELRCFSCGYLLRGLPLTHACPECGLAISVSLQNRRRRPGTLFWCSGLAAGLILGAMITARPSGLHHPGISRSAVARAEVNEIAKQVQLYLLDNTLSALPSGFTLDTLATGPSPYLRPSDLVDPWGCPYVALSFKSGRFSVMSYGADCVQGGVGDDAEITSTASAAPVPPVSSITRRGPARGE